MGALLPFEVRGIMAQVNFGGPMTRLGGWWRLWIVASIALGIIPAIIAFQDNHLEWRSVSPAPVAVEPTKAESSAIRQDVNEARRRCIVKDNDSVRGFDNGQEVVFSSSCVTIRTINAAIFAFFAPGAMLLAIGLAVSWVRQGFKDPSAH